ncbi:MAG: gamma-glutamyltransferase, partial [Bacteroidia bacterium]|nr:gamma-glutamyltransferase [Bacteroidia bacterium]
MATGISAGHKLTRDTAKEVLENGGNAFDAAIAAYAVMFISEPAMASAGASGFANCFRTEDGFRIFDFFSQTPKRRLDFN